MRANSAASIDRIIQVMTPKDKARIPRDCIVGREAIRRLLLLGAADSVLQ